MKKEHDLILSLCCFADPDAEHIKELLLEHYDIVNVLGNLLYNRMGPVAWYVLKSCRLTQNVNREIRNSLQMIYESSCKKANRFRKMLAETADILNELDFPYAVLKGGRLAYEYPIGLRTSNDLDILINQQDITDLSVILKSAGYVQGYIRDNSIIPASRTEILTSRLNRGETVPFVKQISENGFNEIDVNFSLDYKAKQSSAVVKQLLEEIKPFSIGKGQIIMTLSDTDFIIHLCSHLYKEATTYKWVEMGRDLSIYKFSDIYFLIHKYLDKSLSENLISRIHFCGLQKECYFSLFLTSILFSVENAYLTSVLSSIKPDDTSYMKEIIDPAKEKIYEYDMPFIDWLFCDDRCKNLKQKV